MLTKCTTRLGADYSCKIWWNCTSSLLGIIRTSFLTDGLTDRQRKGGPYMSPLLWRGDTKMNTISSWSWKEQFYNNVSVTTAVHDAIDFRQKNTSAPFLKKTYWFMCHWLNSFQVKHSLFPSIRLRNLNICIWIMTFK
jgi:hypothetical protein